MKQKTRDRIVEVADQHFYRAGFSQTSFADIADELGISRGNFYHHFKTKDEILDAVIEYRLAKTQKMLDDWEADNPDPVDRISCFIRILVMNKSKIALYGCPVGTLSGELAKLDHELKDEATKIFTLFRNWLARQFAEVGRKDAADDLAMHLLSRSQGVATLANAFNDLDFLHAEVDLMFEWLAEQLN
ncbi:TetR/AcrR family transcriptional regulator [Terasakiella sp. A23]|uniref:TetR/AcrR family transcriptional regulator n=1 Tax=Terasakiella sp. FCG-A23 TaxID=3080561 RepID=UPI0029549DEA|nr:TetR/AcrR family transcriptional regulator [Terasakiella sp. A23]MDV7339691.1 TetR/AcrR family transcriptional regulator [Terasakiella sp. A23]